MNSGKKIIYTDSAKERLEKFQFEVKQEIENYFQDRKYVPGDDFIEVTASDIDEVAQRFKIVRQSKKTARTLLFAIYSLMGIILLLVGLFYNQLQLIIHDEPQRLILIVSGFLMALMSWYYSYFVRFREKRDEIERMMHEDLKQITVKRVENISKIINKASDDIKNKIKPQANIIIHSAKYFSEKNYFNVTTKIKELVADNVLEFTVNNDFIGGDPNYGKIKVLEIEYTINGERKKVSAMEGTTIKME